MLSFKEQLLQSLDVRPALLLTREHADWLLSDITAEVWNMRFGETNCSVNWRIRFGTSFLTSPQHARLLRTLKYWVLIQTHPTCCGRRTAAGQVAYGKVIRTLRQIDYVLLRDKEWRLSEFGFRAVSSGEISNMLFAFEGACDDETSVYGWDKQLSSYLIEQGDGLTNEQFEFAKAQMPSLSDVELPKEEWTLSLNREQLIRARAYLLISGIYKRDRRLGYELSPQTKLLAEDIYRDTLWGRSQKSIHEELCLGRFESYLREYEGIDVRTSVGEEASERGFNNHKRTLQSVLLLSRFECDVPTTAIEEALSSWKSVPENFRPAGRFRQPAFWEVIDTFRKSTEFALRYGDDLITSYLNVVNAASAAHQSTISFMQEHDVRDFIMPSIRELGVNVWALRTSIALPLGYPQRDKTGAVQSGVPTYFHRLRANEGLIDLLEVLVGAIQHNVGALSARRQSELRRLPIVGALDSSRKFLLFENAKSGWNGLRSHEARPIPSLVADLIDMLERLNKGMPDSKDRTGYLFSLPGERGSLVHHISAYNGALDTLCDYFETPLNSIGKRNYIRQHQLRKFFVVAFFYGSSYSSIETLRWFLGHSDAEYLWHYITEEIPGNMLRSVEATFIVDELTTRANSQGLAPSIEFDLQARETLESLIFERFKTNNFKLIDADALENYIAVLLKRGLTVAPVFYDCAEGRRYVMGVTFGQRGNL